MQICRRMANTANGCTYYSKVSKLSSSNCRLAFEDGIEEEMILTLHPNPFNETTIIHKLKQVDLHESVICIYDIFGKVVLTAKHPVDYSTTITREHLSSGIYIVQLFTNSEMIATAKMIVE